MTAPERNHVTIRRLAPGENAGRWAEAIATFDPHAAGVTLLKQDNDTWVWRANLLGQDVVVKQWRLTSLASRVKSWARAGRAWRHWLGAERLTKASVRTARPIILLTGRDRESFASEWLVMDFLRGRSVLSHLARGDLGPRREHAVARAIGRDIDRLLSAGWYNRDHKPANLIVTRPDPDGAGGVEVAVIDCVAIKRGNRTHAARMLAALMLEPIGCNCRPRATLQLQVLRAYVGPQPQDQDGMDADECEYGWFKVNVQRLLPNVERLVRRVADPRPKVNPLDSERLQ